MYIFVRVTAVIFMIIGILLMVVAIIYGVIAGVNLFTNPSGLGPTVPGFGPLMMTAGGGLLVAVAIFLQGLVITAMGQLMLLFIDIAVSAKETAQLLTYMRRPDLVTEVVPPPE